MTFEIFFKPQSLKDLKKIDKKMVSEILIGIEKLKNDLRGNVKKLTNYTPEYRLRIGNYRILFEIEKNQVIIYKIKHRRDAYE